MCIISQFSIVYKSNRNDECLEVKQLIKTLSS